MNGRQFAFRSEDRTYRVGLIDPKQGNRFVELATVEQQYWANQITLALNEREALMDAPYPDVGLTLACRCGGERPTCGHGEAVPV